jgi:hypothetical protein
MLLGEAVEGQTVLKVFGQGPAGGRELLPELLRKDLDLRQGIFE